MILRRITTAFKRQDWFTVGIETLIVVLGVFLGLQVQGWATERAEASQQTEIIASIAQDLRLDVEELETGKSFLTISISAANHALAGIDAGPIETLTLPMRATPTLLGKDAVLAVPAGTPLQDVEKSRLWSIASMGYFPSPSPLAYDALVSTGKLGLVKDAALVRDLQAYYSLWHDVERSNEGTFRPIRNHAIEVGQRYGLTPFTIMDEKAFLALLSENEELRTVLQTQLEFKVLQLQLMNEIDRQGQAILVRLKETGVKQ